VYDFLTGPGSPIGVSDKRCAVDLIIGRESLQRLGAALRWAPTNRQLADALTKDAAEPTDLLRAAMRSNQYQLGDEPTLLSAAAAEREKRKETGKKNTTTAQKEAAKNFAMAKRKRDIGGLQDTIPVLCIGASAERGDPGVTDSSVNPASSGAAAMVKVTTDGISENEMRWLLESMFFVHGEEGSGASLLQTKSQAKLKVFLSFICTSFKGSMALCTLTYTRNTQALSIQCGAAFQDQMEKVMEAFLRAFKAVIAGKQPLPLAKGSDGLAQCFPGKEDEVKSIYIEEKEAEIALSTGKDPPASSNARAASTAVHAPNTEEYVNAINHIMNEGKRMLAGFPEWADKFAGVMKSEFGAGGNLREEKAPEQFFMDKANGEGGEGQDEEDMYEDGVLDGFDDWSNDRDARAARAPNRPRGRASGSRGHK
jgi:hypothetical protein